MIAVVNVLDFPALYPFDHTKLNLRKLSEVLKTHNYGCLVAFQQWRTDLKLSDFRILSIVERVKIEIPNLAFRGVVDVFPKSDPRVAYQRTYTGSPCRELRTGGPYRCCALDTNPG